MGNPERRAELARQKKWTRETQQKIVEYVELRTIPTHFRIKVLRFALYAAGAVSMLTPHSVYLSHMLVREEMRKLMYGSPTEGSAS